MEYTEAMFADLARTAHDGEAAAKMAAILNGTLDPLTIEAVEDRNRSFYTVPRTNELALIAFDVLFDLHGIEAIRCEGEWLDNYHGDVIASYANTGDTYCTTLVHDHESGELVLTSYGDWLEAWERDHEKEGA
jgi:hypothetical protein